MVMYLRRTVHRFKFCLGKKHVHSAPRRRSSCSLLIVDLYQRDLKIYMTNASAASVIPTIPANLRLIPL
jgi:hypothetical protein